MARKVSPIALLDYEYSDANLLIKTGFDTNNERGVVPFILSQRKNEPLPKVLATGLNTLSYLARSAHAQYNT